MTHDTPPSLISVVTPSFNHAQFIRKTIDSVIGQDYPAIEHIVVDGGSSDGTVEILQEYGSQYPGRFRWISEPDRGQSDAFNKGLAMARGEFIGWQNSDDYYLEGAFADPLSALQRDHDLAMVYGDYVTVDQDGRRPQVMPSGVMDMERLLNSCYIPNQSAFIRRDVLLAMGGLDVDLHYAMDWDLWLRLAAGNRLQYIPGPRGALRILSAAKTNSGLLTSRLEIVRLVDRILTRDAISANLIMAGQAALERHLMDALQIALAFDEQNEAEGLLRRLLKDFGPSPHWSYFCKRTMMRRVMTDLWYGRLDPMLVSPVPRRALKLQLGGTIVVGTSVTRQTESLALMFAALDQASARGGRFTLRALPYVVRAIQTDRSLFRYPGTFIAILRMLLGNAMVDSLSPLFHEMRRRRARRLARRGR